jgi:acyl-CoA thioesterase FadM
VILGLRLPWTALRARRRASIDITDASVLRLRVRPLDLDLYGHVNNGRFLTLMDLGRTDWAVRTGLAKGLRTKAWKPVAGAATVRFRRSLNPFGRFELHTRLAGWDDRWWFFDQEMYVGGKLAASAWVKVAILGPKADPGPRACAVVHEALGWPIQSPDLPDGLRAWQTSGRS